MADPTPTPLTDADRLGGWYEQGVWVAPEGLVVGLIKRAEAAARADERERWEDERDHLLVPFAALADEYERSANPAPYTSERALWERFSGLLADALAQPADTEGAA